MCVTAWAIWNTRRKAIHEGLFQSPLSTNIFVENFLAELGQVAKKKVKVKPPCTQQKAWIPPLEGAVKVNTDVAVARNNSSGVIAAVARSDTGEYLGSSAVLVEGISDPKVLEAMAVR
jgi:hypothetical protein